MATYTITKEGKITDENWIKAPWCAFIHDCAITPNWLIMAMWPFEADIERMKEGKQHWAWNYEREATWIVTPRRKSTPLPVGWKEGESRHYKWKNCMAGHTSGAWEGEDGKLYVESSRVLENGFPFFPPVDGRMPAVETKADFVRWEFDLAKESESVIPDPEIIIDLPAEFPRMDERFNTQKYEWFVVPVFQPGGGDDKNIYQGLNTLAMHNHRTNKTQFFYTGEDSGVQEPVFVPRSKDAAEGDGWVVAMVERKTANRCDLIVLDTKDFEKPVAVVQLPFHVKAQVHGNWVDGSEMKSIVKEIVEDLKISGRGALEPM